MRTFSIYRGQSRTGIGEGPGNPPVPQGEQYLAADGTLGADGELLTAARPWMTPDWRVTDEEEFGDRIETWSYFRHGPLRLVVRVVPAGTYDRRAAYFAHGRAFLAQELAGACDPGALLGRSEAFDEPWRDGKRPVSQNLPTFELVRPEQVQQEPGVAGALLAHLYQGLVSGYPVVMAVPVAEFQAGSALHALVSFARAALPLPLKIDCRLRVFTRLPELFLRHLRADLIVIPEKEAGDALAARRDATLLDRKGVRREGREISREAADYAEAVLRRFMAFKGGGLLAFSGAIGAYLPQDRLPGEQEIARIPALYNFLIARTDPAKLGEWLKSSLVRTVDDRPTGLPWESLIRPEDWRALSFGDLAEILLTEASGEEARTLVQRAETEARRPERREQISEKRLQSCLGALPAERRPALLARLLRGPDGSRSLVAPEVAARLSASLSAAELLATGAAAPLLAAELEAGLLGRRAGDVAGLAGAAAHDSRVAGVLAQATSSGTLSPDWALRLLEGADEPAVIRAAAEILPVAMASLPWKATLQPLFGRLLALPGLPASLQAPLAAALRRADPADPASGLHDWLILTELLVRSGAPEPVDAVEEAWRTAVTLTDAGDRQDFVRKVADPGWRSLRPDRLISLDGRFNPAWAESFADLLFQSAEVRDQLSTTALLKLSRGGAEIGSWLDPRMKSDFPDTTAELLAAGHWSLWRSRSGLEPASLRQAALAWLTSKIWTGRAAPQARLEDWKQVLADRVELSGDDVACLFDGEPLRPCWPWIPPFQDMQLQDLCRMAHRDLGALAELAERLDAAKDLPYPIPGTTFEHVLAQVESAGAKGLPGNALAHLADSPDTVPAAPLSPRQVALLYDQTRHRKERAATAVRRSVKTSIDREPLAALQAADRLPEWSGELLGAIQRWRNNHPQEAQRGEIGEILGRRSRPAGKSAVPTGSRPQLHPVVRALLQGEGKNGCWKKLSDDITSYVGTAAGLHPVARIVDELREAYPFLNGSERETLASRGWSIFAAVTKIHCTILRQPLQRGAPLPALELASLMLPHLGLGRIALRLLFLDAARPHISQGEWWDSLLAALAGCRQNGGMRQPGDREEAALALIHQAIPDLFASSESAQPALNAIGDRMERFYLQQGLPFLRNLEPRLQAGAAL
ncbi:MAG TPA: hypothetical protein VGS07_18720 [Thermoanaerobaculia bacterium]|jgi:hypothetical protein|nr:hypothetical protein [Thermoanaerobaculia bacterium]